MGSWWEGSGPDIPLGAADTENTDYGALPKIFAGRIGPSDVLVDVGCGRGRVINWWIRQGYSNKVIGIELDEEVASRSRRRLSKYPNVTILSGDAADLLPDDGTVFYLYNPFDARGVERFKDRLSARLPASRDITILYYNCRHVDVFRRDPDWSVEVVDGSGHLALPFDPFAVIRPRRAC